MVSKTRKLALQLFAFAAAVFVLLAYMSVFPNMTTYAAGTDLYVGYSGRNNNFSTVQAAVDRAASLNPSSEATRVTMNSIGEVATPKTPIVMERVEMLEPDQNGEPRVMITMNDFIGETK